MPDSSPRRRFQFSIASLLWLMLVLAFAAYGFREHRLRIEAEEQLAKSRASKVLFGPIQRPLTDLYSLAP